jgi:hypothetical protein
MLVHAMLKLATKSRVRSAPIISPNPDHFPEHTLLIEIWDLDAFGSFQFQDSADTRPISTLHPRSPTPY